MAAAETPKKIRLQSESWVPAVEAGELKVGDQLMYYSPDCVYQIAKIETVSEQFLAVTEVNTDTGQAHTRPRRVKKTRLVARVPEEQRRPLGYDAPVASYRAQVRPLEGFDWITVSHGPTAEAAAFGNLPSGERSYFGSGLLDGHGLGGPYEESTAAILAMTDGATLTAANGHSFRILPPEQSQQPAHPTPGESPAPVTMDDAGVITAAPLPAADSAPCIEAGDVEPHGSAGLVRDGAESRGAGLEPVPEVYVETTAGITLVCTPTIIAVLQVEGTEDGQARYHVHDADDGGDPFVIRADDTVTLQTTTVGVLHNRCGCTPEDDVCWFEDVASALDYARQALTFCHPCPKNPAG